MKRGGRIVDDNIPQRNTTKEKPVIAPILKGRAIENASQKYEQTRSW